MKLVLKDLRDEHAGVEFTRGVPTVSYKETVTTECAKPALSKSPNKHNRLYVIACPLGEEVSLAIETYKVNSQQDVKKRARIPSLFADWDCLLASIFLLLRRQFICFSLERALIFNIADAPESMNRLPPPTSTT